MTVLASYSPAALSPAGWQCLISLLLLVNGEGCPYAFVCAAVSREKKWRGQAAIIDLVRYKGCVIIGADTFGLFLRPHIPFRFGHPPLLVPWTEIAFQGKGNGFLFSASVELSLGKEEQVSFEIREKLAEKIQAVARKNWS